MRFQPIALPLSPAMLRPGTTRWKRTLRRRWRRLNVAMFEKLKKLVEGGAGNLETWPCDPLVIVDESGGVIWSKPALVHYAPGDDRYEDGPGEAVDSETGKVILRFKLEKIQHRDALGMTLPFGTYVPWGESGVTVFGADVDGHSVILYTGSHASSYLHQLAEGKPEVEEPALD